MAHYTSDQLATFPWIVSCDTLRTEDLLVKFWSAAEQIGSDLADQLPDLQRLAGEDSSETDWNDEQAGYALERLTDTLQDAAPTGFWFGASEGDGACFGFWIDQDWADALEHCGIAADDDPEPLAAIIQALELDGIDPDNVEDAYQGRAEGWSEESAGRSFAEELAYNTEAAGVDWGGQCAWPLGCIDWDAAWLELQMGDGYRLHDIGGGEWLVFRSV